MVGLTILFDLLMHLYSFPKGNLLSGRFILSPKIMFCLTILVLTSLSMYKCMKYVRTYVFLCAHACVCVRHIGIFKRFALSMYLYHTILNPYLCKIDAQSFVVLYQIDRL